MRIIIKIILECGARLAWSVRHTIIITDNVATVETIVGARSGSPQLDSYRVLQRIRTNLRPFKSQTFQNAPRPLLGLRSWLRAKASIAAQTCI